MDEHIPKYGGSRVCFHYAIHQQIFFMSNNLKTLKMFLSEPVGRVNVRNVLAVAVSGVKDHRCPRSSSFSWDSKDDQDKLSPWKISCVRWEKGSLHRHLFPRILLTHTPLLPADKANGMGTKFSFTTSPSKRPVGYSFRYSGNKRWKGRAETDRD